MRCGLFGKSTGIVRMAPTVAEDAPDALEKNIAISKIHKKSVF